jgi:hypothetical protein
LNDINPTTDNSQKRRSLSLHPLPNPPHSTTRQPLQPRLIPIEHITITPIRIGIRILPDGLIRPAARNRARRTSPPRQHQRTRVLERRAIPCAGPPPAEIRVDDGIPPRQAVVLVREGLDPGDGLGGGETAAARDFEVEHAGQRDAVGGPAAAVRDEERCLHGAGGGAGLCEVVAAADEAGGRGAAVVRGELWWAC